jgi:hypothetical protein
MQGKGRLCYQSCNDGTSSDRHGHHLNVQCDGVVYPDERDRVVEELCLDQGVGEPHESDCLFRERDCGSGFVSEQ